MPDQRIPSFASRLKLLTLGNPKLLKGMRQGYLSLILHLAPARASGYNTCPAATTECITHCLNTSGMGKFDKVQAARIRRTKEFYEDRPGFLAKIHKDIGVLRQNCNAETLWRPAVRLNGTSDIRWELYNIMQQHPDIPFYDYTKLVNRRNLPPNYTLTFSFSGANFDACQQALANGMNVAVVFNKAPATWMGYPVIDGDEDDLRFLDAKPCIVALKPKGSLRRNLSSPFIGDNHVQYCG